MCWNKAAGKSIIMYVIDDNGDRQKIDPDCKCSWDNPDVTPVRIDEPGGGGDTLTDDMEKSIERDMEDM